MNNQNTKINQNPSLNRFQVTWKELFIAQTLTIILKFISLTYKFSFFGPGPKQLASPYIIAIWHEYAVGGVCAMKNGPYTILVSSSKDGFFVDYFIRKLGLKTLRGSSGAGKGGIKAFVTMLNILKNQQTPIAITVDGPKGPRHIPKAGVIELALKANVPIYPVKLNVKNNRAWIFKKSWDQTQIPKFFAKIDFLWGDAFIPNPNISIEENIENLKLNMKKM